MNVSTLLIGCPAPYTTHDVSVLLIVIVPMPTFTEVDVGLKR